MNLAIEYLTRSNLVEEFLEFPCSLFLTNMLYSNKLVITIEKEKEKDVYLVHHWHLDKSDFLDKLPPTTVYEVQNLFSNQHVIIPGFQIFPYQDTGVPHRLNDWREPMTKFEYDEHSSNILNSTRHRKHRENWLWNEYIRTNHPELMEMAREMRHSYYGAIRILKEEIIASQKSLIQEHPSQWTRWLLWKTKMLFNKNSIASELVFRRMYLN